MNKLYYGDNIEVLEQYVGNETIDLCYIDPPFNSKRDYNQIYNNVGKEDKAQVQAFVDTWEWDEAAMRGLERFDLVEGERRYPEKTKLLVNSFANVLGRGSMLAYIISISQRIIEIHRVLKPTGSFYLHCDATASHYIKLILDSVFCANGGDFQNEIIWSYQGTGESKKRFKRKHDTIFFYTKGKNHYFSDEGSSEPISDFSKSKYTKHDDDGSYKEIRHKDGKIYKQYMKDFMRMRDVWEIPVINAQARERLGYPTQKPETLLEKIILASSKKGDVVLDAYCGCGTTVAVAERLKRKWIGIDITYQSVSLIMKRLTDTYGNEILNRFATFGIPRDIDSAKDLAQKSHSRKEFEIWSVMTYSNNKAIPNEKKGADGGFDGKMYITTSLSPKEQKPILFSVKSGRVNVAQIRDFIHVIDREQAVAGVFITLNNPTRPMLHEATLAGTYKNPLTGNPIEKLKIVTVQEIMNGERENFPNPVEVLNKAARKVEDNQGKLNF